MASSFWKDGCGDRLNTFINMDKFCDVCIKFGDDEAFFTLNCHYVVLALHSDVFRDTLEDQPLKDNRRCLSFTEMSETEQTVVADIMLSFYNGILTIDEHNFETVYKFAKDYKVHWILKQARQELHRFITEGNLLSLMLISEEVKCKALQSELIQYICHNRLSNYSEVMTSRQMMDISPELLKVFLKANKHLDNRAEMATLESVMAWMGKSPVKLAYTKKLMRHISWERLATSEVEVQRLSDRLVEEFLPLISESNRVFVKKCLQDAANYAACRSTMERAHAVFITSRWTTFPADLAEFVMSNNFVNVENEYVIAEAALTWIDSQDQRKLPTEDLRAMLSAIRLDRLHSTYLLTALQPHVMQYGITPNEWHIICAKKHPARTNSDETISGSIVRISLPPKKIAKDFLALKDGTYTLTAACKCSYLCINGPHDCLSIKVMVNSRSAPPVAVKNSQCQYCNRIVLHLFCKEDDASESYPSLNCGNFSRMRQMLKSASIKLYAVLSEAEDRSNLVTTTTWYRSTLNTVLRTLSNDNIKSLTEYEILEAALDWLDYRLPDKSYLEVVLACVRLDKLHHTYLKEIVTMHIKNQYIMKPEVWKAMLKVRHSKRRAVPITPCYKKIMRCFVPRPVLELVEGGHAVQTECLCEATSYKGEIYTGVLTVTMTITVKKIPALTVTAKCSKCNISLRHAFLTTAARLPYYPGLATASVYKLREIFTLSLQANDSSDSESDSTASPVGRRTIGRRGSSLRKRSSLVRGLTRSSQASRDTIALNVILGP